MGVIILGYRAHLKRGPEHPVEVAHRGCTPGGAPAATITAGSRGRANELTLGSDPIRPSSVSNASWRRPFGHMPGRCRPPSSPGRRGPGDLGLGAGTATRDSGIGGASGSPPMADQQHTFLLVSLDVAG